MKASRADNLIRVVSGERVSNTWLKSTNHNTWFQHNDPVFDPISSDRTPILVK